MKTKPLPTQTEIRSLLHYDPDSGVFTWLKRSGEAKETRRWNARYAGARAGTEYRRYGVVCLEGTNYQFHRIAWVYANGAIPSGYLVDHVNGDGFDNRLCNLRLATYSQNNANRRKRPNISGLKGVTANGRRWRAKIKRNSVEINIGTFASKEEAHAAYQRMAQEIFEEFAHFGGSGQ